MRKLLLMSLVLSACSPVRSVWLRDDWDPSQAQRIKRLQVLVSPQPQGREDLGELFGLLSREYINEHLDFLVYSARWEQKLHPKAACVKPLDGILHLRPRVQERGDKLRVEVHGELFACEEEQILWRGHARLTGPKTDPLFEASAAEYAERLGEPVRAFVAPSFQLLRQLLDRLPKPKLSESDIDEKIDLD